MRNLKQTPRPLLAMGFTLLVLLALVLLAASTPTRAAGLVGATRSLAAPARESETAHPEATETHHGGGTETAHPEATETHHPEATETHHPEGTETAHPEATETHHPEGTETAHPEATETHHPEGTETAHPEGTETAHPEATETHHPEATQTHHPESTVTATPSVVSPGGGSRTFVETGKTVQGRFLQYWDNHGSLPQQGFPISNEFTEASGLDPGKSYTVQYFERAIFEHHPENAGTPFEVLLAQLGTYRYQAKYGSAGAPGQQASTVNPITFKETGKTLGGKFRAYWESHGGLAQQGFPISNEFTEASALDPGKSYTVQYFERAVFEYHPEYAGTPYEVLLAQLGTYRYQALHGGQ